MSSVVYFDTIAHDFFYFQRNCQFFSQQFSCESHKLLNRLSIDLLQIGTGTDWLNSFIKSRKFSSTILFYNHYQCTLILLSRRFGSTCSRLVFYMFPLIKSFKKFRHCRSTIQWSFRFLFFLNPSWCSRNTCSFLSGLISFVFLDMLESPFL